MASTGGWLTCVGCPRLPGDSMAPFGEDVRIDAALPESLWAELPARN